MAKAKFERTKPAIDNNWYHSATLDHGKTTLTAAITK